MADAKKLQDAFDGRDGEAKPLPWRVVEALRDGQVGDLVKDIPGGPHKTPSMFDHVTLLAKIFTRRYPAKTGEKLDAWDMLVRVYQKLYESE